MRLDKYLADCGVGTRSTVKETIRRGSVTVNAQIVTRPEYQVKEEQDEVIFQGVPLQFSRFQYYMLHKPAGVVTATRDKHEQTVMDLLPTDAGKNLSPVGRLDKDTEGLLLITNDGQLAHQLLSPKKHVAKTYYVVCQGQITKDDLAALEAGVSIGDDTPTLPAKTKLLSQTDDSFCLELTITEGRFHQVKRMMEAVGSSVTYLKRLSMGSLVLDETLPIGEYRPLSRQELEALKALQPAKNTL